MTNHNKTMCLMDLLLTREGFKHFSFVFVRNTNLHFLKGIQDIELGYHKTDKTNSKVEKKRRKEHAGKILHSIFVMQKLIELQIIIKMTIIIYIVNNPKNVSRSHF